MYKIKNDNIIGASNFKRLSAKLLQLQKELIKGNKLNMITHILLRDIVEELTEEHETSAIRESQEKNMQAILNDKDMLITILEVCERKLREDVSFLNLNVNLSDKNDINDISYKYAMQCIDFISNIVTNIKDTLEFIDDKVEGVHIEELFELSLQWFTGEAYELASWAFILNKKENVLVNHGIVTMTLEGIVQMLGRLMNDSYDYNIKLEGDTEDVFTITRVRTKKNFNL